MLKAVVKISMIFSYCSIKNVVGHRSDGHTCATGGTANFRLNAGISWVKSKSSCCSALACSACAGLLYWATRESILDDLRGASSVEVI